MSPRDKGFEATAQVLLGGLQQCLQFFVHKYSLPIILKRFLVFSVSLVKRLIV